MAGIYYIDRNAFVARRLVQLIDRFTLDHLGVLMSGGILPQTDCQEITVKDYFFKNIFYFLPFLCGAVAVLPLSFFFLQLSFDAFP